MLFTKLRKFPLFLFFWEIFMMNVWNFVKFCQILKLRDLSYDCYYGTLHWFLNIEPILQAWNESNLIMVYNSFYALLISFANISLRIFASKFMRDTSLYFLHHLPYFPLFLSLVLVLQYYSFIREVGFLLKFLKKL